MQLKTREEKSLLIAIIFSMFLWGLSWPSGKVLSRYCSAVNFSVYRYILVIATLLIALPFMGVSLRIRKAGIPMFIVSGILLSVYSYFFFVGIKLGSPGAGGVLVTTLNPIIAYAIGTALSRKIPGSKDILGLVLGMAACCVLLKVWDPNSSIADSGNLYFLLAAFTWAVMSKFTSKGAQYGTSMGFSLWQYIVTLACLTPLVNVPEFAAVFQIKDPIFWLNLFFGSVIVTAIATTMFFYSTTRIGAERASSFIFLVPLCAALSSFLFLGEQIHLHTAVGGVLGIGAVYLINIKTKRV